MHCFAILFIILLNHTALGQGEADLTLQDNPGLHAFSYYGAFADDISFGKLIVTIDTKRVCSITAWISRLERFSRSTSSGCA